MNTLNHAWSTAVLCASLLGACGDRADAVRPGVPDARTLGLAASANVTVYRHHERHVGFSAFAGMGLTAELTELARRHDIRYFSDAEALQVRAQLHGHYADIAPSWWRAAARFRAAFFMDQYLVYLADDPAKPGFVMLRIQAGRTSLLPPGRREPAPADSRQQARRPLARQAMKDSGIAVGSSVFEQGGSSRLGGDTPSVFVQLYSQYGCQPSERGPASVGRVALLAFQENEPGGDLLKSAYALALPPSALPCHVDEHGVRKHVVKRAIYLSPVITTADGFLITLGVNHVLGESGMLWGGDTLQAKNSWIFWCSRSQNCELLSDYVAPDWKDAYRGPQTAFAAGLDAQGRPTLQQWRSEWGAATGACVTSVQRTWTLAQRARLLAVPGQHITAGVRGHAQATNPLYGNGERPVVLAGPWSQACTQG